VDILTDIERNLGDLNEGVSAGILAVVNQIRRAEGFFESARSDEDSDLGSTIGFCAETSTPQLR